MAAPAHIFLGWQDASDSDGIIHTWNSLPCSDKGTSENLPFLILSGSNSAYVDYDFSASSLSEGWLFAWYRMPSQQDDSSVILRLTGPTENLFRLVSDGTTQGDTKAQYYDGSSWTDIGALSVAIDDSAPVRLDVHWNIADSGGEFTIYVNGTQAVTMTGDTKYTPDTVVDIARFKSPDTSQDADIGIVVVDSVDTRGLVWDSAVCSGNGSYTEWSSDEPAVDNDVGGSASGLESQADANGERFTLTYPAINSNYTGYAVESVAIAIESAAITTDPMYIKPLVRISSTDYNPASSIEPSLTDENVYIFKMNNDPSTASAWASQAAVEAAEMGIESSTTA